MIVRSLTSCIRSLSAATITTCRSCSAARLTALAIKSSASTPSCLKIGMLKARTICSQRAICCFRSVGRRRAVGFVRVVDLFAKRDAPRVHRDRQQRRPTLAHQALQHADRAVHRVRRLARRTRERCDRVIGAQHVATEVDDVQHVGCCRWKELRHGAVLTRVDEGCLRSLKSAANAAAAFRPAIARRRLCCGLACA